MNIETLAIKSTQFHDANASAVVSPIYLSTTFERESDSSIPHGHIYTRASNPNRNSLEKAYALLEGERLEWHWRLDKLLLLLFFSA